MELRKCRKWMWLIMAIILIVLYRACHPNIVEWITHLHVVEVRPINTETLPHAVNGMNRKLVSSQRLPQTSRILSYNGPDDYQEARIRRIQRGCTKLKRKPMLTQSYTFLYCSKYNFAICKVPKSGSTFLLQFMSILEHETAVQEEFLKKERYKIQHTTKLFNKKTSSTPSIVVSRDPYSRLYSAYIDKVYLPPGMVKSLQKKCYAEVSFQEFLDFVTSGHTNPHWAPTSSLCSPCNGNIVGLIKQESFAADIIYILDSYHVETKERTTLMEMLYDKRTEYSIQSLVNTYYYYASPSRVFHCPGAKAFVERIWTSFQIQGYIKDTIPFPENVSEESCRNSVYVTELLLNASKTEPLMSDSRKTQRKAAMVKAYESIKNQTISKIKKKYKADFELFGYDPDAPFKRFL